MTDTPDPQTQIRGGSIIMFGAELVAGIFREYIDHTEDLTDEEISVALDRLAADIPIEYRIPSKHMAHILIMSGASALSIIGNQEQYVEEQPLDKGSKKK